MNIVQNIIGAAWVPLAAIAGSKFTGYIAQVSPHALPEWAAQIVGPVGALVGTLLAIRWLLTRLDRAENKAEERDKERDKNLTLIAQMTVQNQTIIEQNSEVLADVKKAIENKTS